MKWINYISIYGPKTNPELFKSENDKLKYYINVYNSLCIYGVLYHSFIFPKNNNKELIISVSKPNINNKSIWNGLYYFFNITILRTLTLTCFLDKKLN